MPFIKNNLFLIALAASVLIVCGVGLAVYFSADSDVMAKITEREQLAATIKSLGNKPVNAETLKTQQAHVAGVKAEYQKVVARSQEINKRGRVMMTVEPNGDKPIAIFPVDKQAYGRHSVELLFVPKYKREMTKLLSTLSPVKPPTVEEIAYASQQVIAMMAEEQAINGPAGTPPATSQPALLLPAGVDPPAAPLYPANGQPAGTTGVTPIGGAVPSAMASAYIQPPPMMITPTPPPMSGYLMAPGAGPLDEVSIRAMKNLKFQKANTSGIYATEGSLYVTQLPEGSRPTLDQMWMALVGWWLQQDLVAAIVETNQAAGATGTMPAIPTIADAKIKRLVGVAIDPKEYYVGASQVAVSSGMGMSMSMSMGSGGAPPPLVDGLTERTSNVDYDVVTYGVRMVMKSSEVQAFQRNLEKRNFYTVLSVGMTAVESGDSTGAPGSLMALGDTSFGAPTTEAAVPEQYYYYGPDPVMVVTLKIEAIFFTDWERDLMPVEMLGKLQPFWRPADMTRHTAETTLGVTP